MSPKEAFSTNQLVLLDETHEADDESDYVSDAAYTSMLERISTTCAKHADGVRGIYVDFIYNPKYYYELTILRDMIMEIINKNPNMKYKYDYEHKPNSTVVTVGYEHVASRYSERSVITIKPKLLKDILYTPDIFNQLYNFMLTYFRVCIDDQTMVPEYDRTINFARYRSKFADTIKNMDTHNQLTTICRNDELYNDDNMGKICITTKVNDTEFEHESTAVYWNMLLCQIGEFMEILLERTFMMRIAMKENEPCYKIELKPETDIRRVLLFPHAAVKTAMRSEKLTFDDVHKERIVADIILYKHRILHAFGVGHRYSRRSIMNSYDNDWQRNNLYNIMPEDYAAMARCYASNNDIMSKDLKRTPDILEPMRGKAPSNYNPKRYVGDKPTPNDAERLTKLFINDFDKFLKEFTK